MSHEELYDFRRDPDALTNLAEDPDCRSEMKRRRAILLRQMRATGDPELEGYESFLTTLG